jgi:hypothetical protein
MREVVLLKSNLGRDANGGGVGCRPAQGSGGHVNRRHLPATLG